MIAENNTQEYADGQVSATSSIGELRVTMDASYKSFFEVASIKNAWDSIKENKVNTSTLFISCLIAQRSDRRFVEKSSFDLKVVADFINLMNFDRVEILDPHSDVALALIKNSVGLAPLGLVDKAVNQLVSDLKEKIILISPDAGAYKKVAMYAEKLNVDVIAANKSRINGEIKTEISADVYGKNLLIVDDIADGGRTFIQLASELKRREAKSVSLCVTHGMFNFGFDSFEGIIDRIFCTNSYREIKHPLVTQIKIKQ